MLSPDLDTLLRGEVELFARLYFEGLVPRILVANFERAPVIR